MDIFHDGNLLARVLLTLATIGYGVIIVKADFNKTHATNPVWTPHARFHVVWQILSYVGFGLIALALIWVPGPYAVERLYLAAAFAAVVYGASFMTLFPGMWDYGLRIKAMDKAKVDVAIVSLTCPNCFFGDRATSLKAAEIVNDSMAEQSRARGDRIRWLASIPWQYPDDAKAELARCMKAGAVGVMQLANVVGAELTDE